MKRRSLLVRFLSIAVLWGGGLALAACDEVTAFCMSAGAPGGVGIQATTVPTPQGYVVSCGMAGVDTTVHPVAAVASPEGARPR